MSRKSKTVATFAVRINIPIGSNAQQAQQYLCESIKCWAQGQAGTVNTDHPFFDIQDAWFTVALTKRKQRMGTTDLIGLRFGQLIVQKYYDIKNKNSRWLCLCDCGQFSIVYRPQLMQGKTTSCGCAKGRWVHGDWGSPEYSSYRHMIQRCLNKNDAAYKYYGGRGITICSRWEDYNNFLSDMGRKPALGWGIDRINNDGNYEPYNCRWASQAEQNQNKRPRYSVTSQPAMES